MNYLNKIIGGRYEIREIIGVGGMAIVYKAFDRIENRFVAVKILKEQFLEDEDLRQRFKNESKAIAVMSHPNIVKVFDVNFGEELLYIVMEHIEGINLKEYIQHRNGLDAKESLHIAMQILRALQHAHDKGIIHRDIKPQNILLLQNGTIKVTDFGIARFNRGDVKMQEDTSAIGSVHYVSPEQVRGEYTDARSDVYSVGIVLYEMLTGEVPFDAADANNIAVMHLQKEAIRPTVLKDTIPVGIEQITMRAMQKNPKDRYQSAAEMLMDLDTFKKNPLVKFDYSYFVDKEPTKYLHVVAEPLPTVSVENFEQPVHIDDADEVQGTMNDGNNHPEDDMKYDDYDDYEFRGRNLTVPLLTTLSVILVAVVGFVMLMVFYDPLSGYFGDNEESKIGKVFSYLSEIIGNDEMEVPNFLNMTFDEIKSKYPDMKFEDPVYVLNSEYEAGRVCAQSPEASSVMTKDTVVKLTIARSATSQIAVPGVVGKNYMTAKSELSAYGFTVVLMPVFAENETIGNVIRTDPVAGTMLETLKKVTVYYASSINTEAVEVPDVVGMLQSLAEEKIRAEGLVVGGISLEPSSASLKGYVISQSPVSDSEYKVAAGSAVYLVVGTGETATSTVSFSITLPDTNTIGTVYLYLNDAFYDAFKNTVFDGSKMVLEMNGFGEDNTFEIYADVDLIYSGTIDFTTDPATIDIDYRAETPVTDAKIPNVIGKTKAAAEEALIDAGFTNYTFTEIENSEAAGVVVSQYPAASNSVEYETDIAIIVYVSKGISSDDPPIHGGEPSTTPRPTYPSGDNDFDPDAPSSGEITIF